jgi:cytochrome b involved in lipid metabolism
MDITDNEVILEGVVYDLREFSKVHPGGSNILNIFGGKDATIHYYMLHPHNKIRTNILDRYKTIDGGTAKNADILGYQGSLNCNSTELQRRELQSRNSFPAKFLLIPNNSSLTLPVVR